MLHIQPTLTPTRFGAVKLLKQPEERHNRILEQDEIRVELEFDSHSDLPPSLQTHSIQKKLLNKTVRLEIPTTLNSDGSAGAAGFSYDFKNDPMGLGSSVPHVFWTKEGVYGFSQFVNTIPMADTFKTKMKKAAALHFATRAQNQVDKAKATYEKANKTLEEAIKMARQHNVFADKK